MANMHEAKKIFQPGDLVRVHDDYTSATILYFKSMFVALDELLRNKLGRTPKDNTERFRMLEKDLPLHYRKLNSLFSIYRDTYTESVSKETCEEVRDEAEPIVEEADQGSKKGQ